MRTAITGFADVNGTRLYYERCGEGPAVLLLHGATLDHRMWRPQVDALCERFEVVTCDLRGYGKSAQPDGAFMHCEDALGLVDHLGLARVVAVGHSVGALYALELCYLAPARVSGFAAICMSALGEPPFPDELVAKLADIKAFARDGRLDGARQLWLDIGWFMPAIDRPDLRAKISAMLADYPGTYWLRDVPAGNLEPPVATRLAELHVPALIVDGGLDLAYNHAVADVLAARIPDARHVRIPDVGHMANLEAPGTVSAELQRLAVACAANA